MVVLLKSHTLDGSVMLSCPCLCVFPVQRFVGQGQCQQNHQQIPGQQIHPKTLSQKAEQWGHSADSRKSTGALQIGRASCRERV